VTDLAVNIWQSSNYLEALGQCIPPPGHVLPVSQYGSWSWKFHANPFGSFCAKLLTNRQTTTITYPPWWR